MTRALETPDRFITGKIGLEYDTRFWETGALESARRTVTALHELVLGAG